MYIKNTVNPYLHSIEQNKKEIISSNVQLLWFADLINNMHDRDDKPK
jgi:hypothetical protein